MKTTNKSSDISLSKETFNQVQEFIQNWLTKTDYDITGNITELSDLLNNEYLKTNSGNKKKQFKKRIFRFVKKQTIKQLNNLLIEFEINSIKVELSDKEKQIILKKKELNLLKAKYNEALLSYKLEKGTYYK